MTSAVKRLKAESIVDETVPVDHANVLAQKIRKEVKDATGCDGMSSLNRTVGRLTDRSAHIH